ncbi:thioredoxin fold domain-containing protein [Vibrio splendidus]
MAILKKQTLDPRWIIAAGLVLISTCYIFTLATDSDDKSEENSVKVIQAPVIDPVGLISYFYTPQTGKVLYMQDSNTLVFSEQGLIVNLPNTTSSNEIPVETSLNRQTKESAENRLNASSPKPENKLENSLSDLKNSSLLSDIKKTSPPFSNFKEVLNERRKEEPNPVDLNAHQVEQTVLQSKNLTAETQKRVNPNDIKRYRGHIEYQGAKFPKVGFNMQGEPTSDGVTKATIRGIVKTIIKAGDSWSIPYKAIGEEKGHMVMFTDPLCPFCKRQYHEFDEINKAGITIHVVFYPRTMRAGQDNHTLKKTLRKIEEIWQSEDRQSASRDIHEGYRSSSPKRENSSLSPVFEHYLLGEMVGITGTPHLLLDNGELIKGKASAKYIIDKFNL